MMMRRDEPLVPSDSSMRTRPSASAIGATPLGTRASKSSRHTRQTVRDVLTGDAAGVERTHGQLGTGLADGLGAMMPTASPTSTSLPVASERP